MNDDSLFDWEEEWTPKIPVQVFIDGEDTTGAGLTEAGSFLNTFFTELHASTLNQMQFHAELEAGGSVAISHIFGVTQVDIKLNPPEEEGGVFYGGILLRPTYITNESTFFGSYVVPTEPTTVLVDEVKSAGTLDGEGGRPAVPGTLSTDETDWLIVQIAKNKPLGDTPVTSGAVKIFRIKDPKFGPYVETNDTESMYLLSASAFASLLTPGLEKFYLCGREVLGIPPLSFPNPDAFDHAFQFIRIRTFELQFDSFEEAAQAHGIVIVAAKLQLYVLNTADATWLLLDSIASFDNFNDYGATFTESTEGVVTTITCSGSNGAGVCSGFEVVVTKHDGGSPTFTGRIFPMSDGSVLAGAPTYTYTRSVACDSTSSSSPISIAMSKFYDPFPDVATVFWDGDQNLKVGTTEVHAQGSFSEGTPAETPDKFLGGLLPTYPQISYSFTHDWSNTYSRHASGMTFYVGPLGGPDEDLFCPKFWSIGKTVYTEDGTLNYTGCALGDMSRYATLTATVYSDETIGGNASVPAAPADTRTSAGSTYTFEAQPTVLDPLVKFRYIGADLHTDRLRMRREETRNGVTQSYLIEDKYGGQHVRDGSPPGTHFGPFRLQAAGPEDGSTGQVFVTVVPPELRIELLRRNGEVVYSWPNVLAESPPAPWQTNPNAAINIVSSLTRRGGVANVSFGSIPSNYASADPIGAWVPRLSMPPTVSDLTHTGGVGSSPLAVGFLDYAAWYGSGSSSTVVYEPGTGAPHNQIGGPLPLPTGHPSEAEAASPWSVSLTYPNSYPTVPLAYSDYALLFPMTKHALTPFTFDGPGSYYNPAQFALPNPPFTPIITRGFLDGVIDSNMQLLQGIILYDVRSNGFIAQMRAQKRSGFSTVWNTHEVIIGNDYDSLPLATVLDEWKALGENSGLSDGKHIFTQFATGAALI